MKLLVNAKKENLWAAVQEQLTDVPSYCGGNGRCGKCRVRLISGEASVSQADRMHLTEKEIAEGYRIACQSRPLTDCEIELSESVCETGMQMLSVDSAGVQEIQKNGQSCSVAIDIGTTTLAFALVNESGDVIAVHTDLNHQRRFGTDVVSRLTYANTVKGGEAELTASIRRDIRRGIGELLKGQGLSLRAVTQIVAAGNTTMEQLFFGLPTEALGRYPFEPAAKDFVESSYQKLFGEYCSDSEEWEDSEWQKQSGREIPVTGFPCIAGYVGGDIAAGLYEVTAAKKAGIKTDIKTGAMTKMLLDIGTNGELACIGEDFILTASTAAGPVFEGGNISCGMSSLPGAICATQVCEDMIECKTIGNRPAVGICGSGLIEAIADLLQLGVIDGSGQLSAPWQKSGYLLARSSGKEIVLTQADIREFQMAKAAIAAGVELVCKAAGIEASQIEECYLAGGLGNSLSVKKAVKTGLLPKKALRTTRMAGNTSLKGAIRLLCEGEQGKKRIRQMLAGTKHIHLANTEGFAESYLAHMEFGT